MEVTEKQFTEAVDGMEVVVDLLGQDVVPGTWTGAKIRYPGSFASAVFARLADQMPDDAAVFTRAQMTEALETVRLGAEVAAKAGRPPVAADPELAALAAIVAALDSLDGGSVGEPHGSFWRVLYYVAERYGYVLATED